MLCSALRQTQTIAAEVSAGRKMALFVNVLLTAVDLLLRCRNNSRLLFSRALARQSQRKDFATYVYIINSWYRKQKHAS